MSSTNYIKQQLKRLGAVPSRFERDAAIPSLVAAVNGLTGTFRGSVQLHRSMLAYYAIDAFDDFSDSELEWEMPLISDFRFVDSAGFYEGWQADMPKATRRFTPFGHDDYHFFFLVKNRKNEIDPAVYAIDHEEPGEKPERHFDLTVGMLLASVEPVPVKRQVQRSDKPKRKQSGTKKKRRVGEEEIAVLVEQSSTDENLSWSLFDVHGTYVIQLEIGHDELPEIVRGLALFWECLFLSLSDRQIKEVAVCDCQDGFNFYVKTTPQIRERRFEVTIDRMAVEFDDKEMMEQYWRAAEIALHESEVLKSFRDSLHPDFQLVGTARANKKFRRAFKPRKK